MALNLYTGQPGSGKSYSVVAHVIIPALKKGRHVVTNIPVEDETLTQVFGGEITQLPLDALDDPGLPERFPAGCVAVVDECWNRWPSGQRVSKAANGDLHWLKEHRHRVDNQGNAMQVVLVTQDPSDLASWVRKLIKHTFWMEKLDTVGADNRFSIKIYKGCPTGENIPKRYLIRQSYGTYDPDIYQYYSSATQSESFDVGDEKAMDRRTSIWRSPGFILQMTLSPAIFIAACVFLWQSISAYREEGKQPEESMQVEVQPSLVNPDPEPLHLAPASLPERVNPAPAQIASLKPSSIWRISGYIRPGTEAPDMAWQSRAGYNEPPSPAPRHQLREPLAILSSFNGIRYVPLSGCEPYSDGINWSCDVDGERVTPWSGQMGLTDTVPGASVAQARLVSAERSETETAAAKPQPIRSAGVAVIPDNSRMPRTLLTDTN